jgi:hypothetical protein
MTEKWKGFANKAETMSKPIIISYEYSLGILYCNNLSKS